MQIRTVAVLAAQDADEFNGRWLPFDVNSDVFNPKPVELRYKGAFLDTMCPKRKEYVKNIAYSVTYLAPVFGDQLRHAQLLAEAYSSTRVFVNLPSLSRRNAVFGMAYLAQYGKILCWMSSRIAPDCYPSISTRYAGAS